MLIKCFVLFAILWAGQSKIAFAMTAEDGQLLFDSIFWLIMQMFIFGLGAGLAIKLINRS